MFSRHAKRHRRFCVRFLRWIIKAARCIHVLMPYRSLANQSVPFGLDFLDFHGKKLFVILYI